MTSVVQADATLNGASVRIDRGGLIGRSARGWSLQVGYECLQLAPDTTAEAAALQFAQLCELVKGAERRCVLALPSAECFFAKCELPPTIHAKDRSAVLYELERHFPLDAESMVAEYRVHDGRNRISAIAVQCDRHVELIHQLQAAGIEVVSIIPQAILVARAIQERRRGQQRQRGSGRLGLLIFDQDSADLLTVQPDGVSQWRQFYDANDELKRHLAVVAEDQPDIQVIVGRNGLPVDAGGEVEFDAGSEAQLESCDESVSQLAAQGANLALRGRWGHWPDFRKGQLAPDDPLFAVRGPLRWLALSIAVSLAVLIAGSWFRLRRLQARSQAVQQAQRDAFVQAFPGRRVPVLLMRTVRSEHRETLGSRGRGDAIKLPTPATTVLRDLYRGLENARRRGDVKFRLMDLDIIDGDCSITIRVVDSAEIGVIAKSLEAAGFDVAPPATEQIDPSKDEPVTTYQSTLDALWIAPTDSITDEERS